MKLNILVPGDEIILLKDFKTNLKNAGQNTSFVSNNGSTEIIIKKGVKLKVDRVYIRQDSEGFNSITFKSKNNKDLIDGRFYLPIKEVNELDVNIAKNKEKREVIKEYNDYSIFRGSKDRLNKILEERSISNLFKFRTELNIMNILNDNMKNISYHKDKFYKHITENNKLIVNKYLSLIQERKHLLSQNNNKLLEIIDCELLKIDNNFYLNLKNLITKEHQEIFNIILLLEGISSLIKSAQNVNLKEDNTYIFLVAEGEHIFKRICIKNDFIKIPDSSTLNYTIMKHYRGVRYDKGILLDYKSISCLNMFNKDKKHLFSFIDSDNNHYTVDEIRKEMTKRKKDV